MSDHSRRRTLVKAMTYRSSGFLVSWLTGMILGVPISLNVAYTLVSNGIATAFYVVHEVLWRRTSWGKRKENSA